MPKYLIQASYTAEGLKGLQKDKASGRGQRSRAPSRRSAASSKPPTIPFGQDDVIVIVDLPDNIAASSLSLAVSASGLVRTKTTPLLTVEEVDKALAKNINYRAPGR